MFNHHLSNIYIFAALLLISNHKNIFLKVHLLNNYLDYDNSWSNISIFLLFNQYPITKTTSFKDYHDVPNLFGFVFAIEKMEKFDVGK